MRYNIFKEKNRRTGKYYPKWRIRFFDDSGEYIKREIGYTQKSITIEKAERSLNQLEKELEAKRLGKPIIGKEDINKLVELYIDSRSPAGGRKGTAWSADLILRTTTELNWWIKALGLKTALDINLTNVEIAINKRKALSGARKGKLLSGNAKNWVVSKLRTFTSWCVQRGHLETDPLVGWKNFREHVSDPKRALTIPELEKLLSVCSPGRRIGYLTAMVTGLRRKEINSLTVGDLDFEMGGVHLSWQNEKNKTGSFFHLPSTLLVELHEYTRGRPKSMKLFPDLSVNHASDRLKIDLKAAGIKFRTNEGKVVFHSFRKTFLTHVNRLNTDPKTLQALARHSNLSLTLNRYVAIEEDQKKKAVEGVFNTMIPDSTISVRRGNEENVSDSDIIGLEDHSPLLVSADCR